MIPDIKPLILHNKPPHSRSRIGVDTLTVSPIDSYSNYLLIVVGEHFTKYISKKIVLLKLWPLLYPVLSSRRYDQYKMAFIERKTVSVI